MFSFFIQLIQVVLSMTGDKVDFATVISLYLQMFQNHFNHIFFTLNLHNQLVKVCLLSKLSVFSVFLLH